PSLSGAFLFKREESPLYGTDLGWISNPQYVRQSPLGSSGDSIITTAIGSFDRTFEIYLSPERFNILQSLVNSSYEFTDWERPVPDSRQAFLASVIQLDITQRERKGTSQTDKAIRARVSLVSV